MGEDCQEKRSRGGGRNNDKDGIDRKEKYKKKKKKKICSNGEDHDNVDDRNHQDLLLNRMWMRHNVYHGHSHEEINKNLVITNC